MFKSFEKLRQRLSTVKPWVTIATLLAVAMLGYYAVLAMRYMSASAQVGSLNGQIAQLQGTTRIGLPTEDGLTAQLTANEQHLAEIQDHFNFQEPDDLMGVLSATARDSNVALLNIGAGDIQLKSTKCVQYSTQPVTVTLEGETTNFYLFLSSLYRAAPTMSASGVRITETEGSTRAQVNLLFHMSPQQVPAKKGGC